HVPPWPLLDDRAPPAPPPASATPPGIPPLGGRAGRSQNGNGAAERLPARGVREQGDPGDRPWPGWKHGEPLSERRRNGGREGGDLLAAGEPAGLGPPGGGLLPRRADGGPPRRPGLRGAAAV